METFERFCAQAHPPLVAALHHHFGDRFLAEDLAQEALVRAGARWATVGAMDSPIGWAYRVGCNLGTSVMRRRAAERRALARRAAYAHDHVHHDRDTADRLVVQEALADLTDGQRRAIIARYFLGLTAPEAAQALGTTAGAIRIHTHRAIERLRGRLDLGPPDASDAASATSVSATAREVSDVG